jgi:hypothetical protein
MDIHAILSQLGEQMGLPQLKLDENRVCRLIFDQRLTVDIEASDDEKIVYLYAVAGKLPPEGKEAVMANILEANLFGKGTGGATFALDHNHHEIYMCRILSVEAVPYQEFVNILEGFVNHLEAWMDKIDRGDVGQSASSQVDHDTSGEDFGGMEPGFIRA